MSLNLTALRWFYALFILTTAALFGGLLYRGQWLQTDLRTLLPEEKSWSAIQIQADKEQENRLNRQIIVLVGHPDSSQAFSLAEDTASSLRVSGLFQTVNDKIQPDIAKLHRQIRQLRLALLPENIRHQLLEQPQVYFSDYAHQIVNPFTQHSLLPLEQDWLGFGRFVLSQSQQLSRMAWHSENGMLYVENEKQTWVLIRATLAEQNMIAPQQTLLDLLEQNKQQAEQQGGKWLATGTALFAAIAKQQAEQESTFMGIIGIGLTLLLLLTVFRTLRVLWLFLPIAIGMLSGITATVLGFGQIHILTLVVGTSLIGVLIDFPLHWLAGSLSLSQWQPNVAMKRLRFTFFISLCVTLLGYSLLGFTALPILQQTALFSAVALVAAILTTSLYLPLLFAGYTPRKRPILRQNLPFYLPISVRRIFMSIAVVFLACGIWRSKWQDDIRQWIALPPLMLQQAKQIGQITGIDLSTQYFLITAEDDENLLKKEKNLTLQLETLRQRGQLSQFQAISQWIMPITEQQQWAAQLNQRIQQEDYQILQDIGLPSEQIRTELKNLLNQPFVSLQQALNTQVGQGWSALYLGELQPQQVASVVKLSGVQDTEVLHQLAGNGIYWQDKRQYLNRAFERTRNQAAWLKLLSFVLAGLLLWRFFGLRKSGKMLLIPFGAILATVGVFGWLGLPISLFAMFGLLLVSAIGIDYTAYMQTAQEPLPTKRLAVVLAAVTTLISFLLLGISSTPAVAAFGLSVSLGVLFSVFITFKLFR
ncbi:MMPL family transporter [Rodentibacter caecimuris]|uniref:Membrane transport protein MMPL domain-containing protein n=1 Tax=Rodentibacter caecimuris TaxID=1796644 RepID=A0ABX3KZN1_9PAST|nr:hypothetical protein BKG89_00545 [Rodentibacter heylii]